jgi:hypothetical protein
MSETYEGWLRSRPGPVQEMAVEFPPMTCVVVDGRSLFVFGYSDDGELIAAPEPLNDDADCTLSKAAQALVPVSDVRSGKVFVVREGPPL